MASKAVRADSAPAENRGLASVEAGKLRAVLKDMTAVVERRNTIPVLSGVVLRSGPSTMTLLASDLDIEIVAQIDHVEPGQGRAFACVVDAGTLDKIVAKAAKGSEIVLERGERMALRFGRSRFDLPVLPVEDFPEMAVAGDWDAQFELRSSDLVAMLHSVSFAQSTEETRLYLNGVFWHTKDGQLFAAATDGHRLARWGMDAPDGAEDIPDVIIPRKAVAVLEKLCDKAGNVPVSVAVSARRLRFEIGAITLTTKTIDGTFPDYTRVIPAGNRNKLWFAPKDLAEATDRVLAVQSDKALALRMAAEAASATVLVRDAERGEASEDIEAKLEGEPLEIGFNGRYLLDVLARLHANPAVAEMSDPARPVLFRDSEDAQRLFVLMPLRV